MSYLNYTDKQSRYITVYRQPDTNTGQKAGKYTGEPNGKIHAIDRQTELRH